MEPLPDLASLSDADLKQLIDELTKEEHEVSYQRRMLHGKIDILRAELMRGCRRRGEERPRPTSTSSISPTILTAQGRTARLGQSEPHLLPGVRLPEPGGRELLRPLRRALVKDEPGTRRR